jgi:excinuclease ABC subunit C
MKIPAPLLEQGRSVIRRYVDTMPGAPGVYRMIDAKGNVLYIGKARSLKNRVQHYINVEALPVRLQRMVAQTASMEITLMRSEAEALLLEANLVKKFNPRFNILLKDDKSFPYIFLSGDHPYPRIAKHRGAKTKKGKYFGPFTSGLAVNETIALLQKAFLLRPCSDNVFKNRTRPCLQYQIKRCSAPCVKRISEPDYRALVDQAQAFLSGKSRQIQEQLVAQMQEESLKLNYEKARVIRDRIRAIAHVQQHGATTAVVDADVLAVARDDRHCCIQLFSIRGGRNYGNRAWFPQHTLPFSDSEILSSFIGRHYQTQPPPGLILVSHLIEEASVLEEALKINTEYKVEIVHPVRGEKRELVDQAITNAREALARHMTMEVATGEALEGVKTVFGLEETPSRIEVYDNSHVSGTNAVGAMIAAGPQGFMKNEYRKFNIKGEELTPGDDYAMLREVLTRRFKRLQEAGGDEAKTPDLVLVDGGAGQLSAAVKVFEELGVQGVALASIAKGPDRNAGREWFHIPGKEPFQLAEGDATLHFLQRLRDEAHRFAIGTHRARRSKVMQQSLLDAIPAIGPARKKALLHHFGSARAVSNASIEDLKKAPGISANMAKLIYGHFHGDN